MDEMSEDLATALEQLIYISLREQERKGKVDYVTFFEFPPHAVALRALARYVEPIKKPHINKRGIVDRVNEWVSLSKRKAA